MCDFSLEVVKSRAATDNEDLLLKRFHTGSKGFVDPADPDCAVCLKTGCELTLHLADMEKVVSLEGTHITLAGEVAVVFETKPASFWGYRDGVHLPTGQFVLLQQFSPGVRAVVTKALPEELTKALTSGVAFDPDTKVEAQPETVV